MATTKFYTEDEALDKVLGKEGTPLRNQYESEMNAFLMGEAIKKARQSKNLTQEELGALIGVKKSQVSRIEKGNNITFATIAKVLEQWESLPALKWQVLAKSHYGDKQKESLPTGVPTDLQSPNKRISILLCFGLQIRRDA